MKKRVLVRIIFEHSGTSYTAVVSKYSPTAIILSDRTVLATNCLVITNGPRKPRGRFKQIFDYEGNLIPLKVLHKPGDWITPLDIKLPLVFAKEN